MLPSSCVVNKTRKFAVFDIPGVQACQQHQLAVTHPNNAKSFPAATVPVAAKLGHRRRKRGTRSEESRIARSLHVSKKKKKLRKSRGVVGVPHPPRPKNQGGNLAKQNATSSSKGSGEAREGLKAPSFDVTKLKASECPLQERYDLCRSVGDECIQEEELRRLLEAKMHPICYDGFEPSGRMHIAQGVMRVINVNKLTKAGCHFKFWVADWFAQLNNKMGGDLKKIQTVGKYMIEIWRATGMDMNNVEFLWASEEINRRPGEYWGRVMEVARLNNLSRVQRCGQIMGRADAGDMSSAQIFYPCMQCADVFFLKADICQLGLDQRKVNMLAREYCDMTKPKIKFKPVILSHHMLAGLKEGQAKMSKSDPDSAIFMEDSAADVKRKIKKAYCPPEVVEANPVLDYCKHIIFPWCRELTISPREGEPVVYKNYEDLEKDYVEAKIHPSELKPVVTDALNGILQPVRDHFEKGDAKKLLETVRKFKVTR